MANDDQKRNYVLIEVESLLRWTESREDNADQRPYICRVPSIHKDLSPDSFKPQLVSIGPLHKKDPNVQGIERLKRSYLHDLLNRSTSPPKQPKTKLEECLQKVNASTPEIKSSYPETEYSDEHLANMMVMDACFILEFCYKFYFDEGPGLLTGIQRFRISVDLMLLENQIPFLVLQHIFDLTKPDTVSLSLTSLLYKGTLFFAHPFRLLPGTHFPDAFLLPEVLNIANHKHVLDCLHKIYQFRPSETVDESCGTCNVPWLTRCKNVWNMCGLCSCLSKESQIVTLDYNHSVVELVRSGVKFKPQEEKGKAMAIEFVKASSCVLWPWRKPPTLVMPTFLLEDFTEVVLRNFIAYEQADFPGVKYFFTSYIFLMDKLINDQADVRCLVESRVLENHLGSDKEAATMFNSLSKNMIFTKIYYTKEIQALDEYYNSFWPNTFAHLRRAYFNNPWSFIALLAGIILFGLNVVQTLFTILSYYK